MTRAGPSGRAPVRCATRSRNRSQAHWAFFDPGMNRSRLHPQHSPNGLHAAALGVQVHRQLPDPLRPVGMLRPGGEVVETLTATLGLPAPRTPVLGQPVGPATGTLLVLPICPWPRHHPTSLSLPVPLFHYFGPLPTHAWNTCFSPASKEQMALFGNYILVYPP